MPSATLLSQRSVASAAFFTNFPANLYGISVNTDFLHGELTEVDVLLESAGAE